MFTISDLPDVVKSLDKGTAEMINNMEQRSQREMRKKRNMGSSKSYKKANSREKRKLETPKFREDLQTAPKES